MTAPKSPERTGERFQVEIPPVVAVPERRAEALELLDDDEIVQLSLKPSLWFIPITSARVVVVFLGLALALALLGSGPQATAAVVVALLAAITRVGFASLQWASRLYVLTNRRVMRFSGVLRVRVAACPLTRVGEATLHIAGYQRLLRLGTIRIRPEGAAGDPVTWSHLARPEPIHQIVTQAIRRAGGNRR
jgi:membrane protein YdbS with pleckstrin-like domain